MKEKQLYEVIKNDCRHFAKKLFFISSLTRFMALISPTLVSWLLGNMTDYFLTYNLEGVKKELPYFICALLLVVIFFPILDLVENLKTVKCGFDYENFLMGRILKLPIMKLSLLEKGTAIERLTYESSELVSNQVTLFSIPVSLAFYLITFVTMLFNSKTNFLFFAGVMAISILPLLRTVYLRKRKAVVRAKASEYSEERKTLEQQLFEAKDLAWGFPVGNLLISGIRSRYEKYYENVGKKACHLGALENVLDFLCEYGVKIAIIVLGAIAVSTGKMNMGALLAGVLIQPEFSKACKQVYLFILERSNEEQYIERLSIMYDEDENESDIVSEEYDFKSIELSQIEFAYDEKTVLSNCNLKIEPGETVCLFGENGSGKSTALNIMCGILKPQNGIIRNEKGVIQSQENLYRNISFCRQNGVVFSGTIFENLFVDDEKSKEAEKLFKLLGMEKQLDYEVEAGGANLSLGEQKKVLLCRALLKKSNILILDEPINHLDDRGKDGLIQALSDYEGTIIFVSHKPVNIPLRETRMVDIGMLAG